MFFKFNKQKTIFNGTIPILPEIFIASVMPMICTCMYNPLDRLRNLCQVQNRIKGSENFFLFISLRERFLTTGTCTYKMPRRNRIPLEHRERIVRAFEDEQGVSWRVTSQKAEFGRDQEVEETTCAWMMK